MLLYCVKKLQICLPPERLIMSDTMARTTLFISSHAFTPAAPGRYYGATKTEETFSRP